MEGRNEWSVVASASAALATATKAAETNRTQTIDRVDASYGAAQIGRLVVRIGGAVVWDGFVHNSREVVINRETLQGQNVTAELGAGATGVVGLVTISGYTEGQTF